MSHREDSFDIAARIDTQGQSAAWSILCAEQAVEQLKPGQVLEVSISDPQLAIDLPRILHQRGEILMTTPQDGGVRLYVRRGPAPSKPQANT